MTGVINKSLNNNNLEITDADLDLINQHTVKPLTLEEVFTFKVVICDNDIDRVGDKMTDEFLEQVAENIKGVTGLKNHDWNVENQLSRLYDAEVVVDDSVKNALGESRKYVLGKAYTLSKYKDYIDSINAGLLKETSISFKSENDICSICGKPMHKNENDIGVCEDGHTALEKYNDKLCYNKINCLTDVLEWSLVAVPCQKNAGIKNKNLSGGNIMKKVDFNLRQLFSSKSFKNLDEAGQAKIKEVLETKDEDLSEEDIQGLIDENIQLKSEIADLKDKYEVLNNSITSDKIKACVSKAVDDLHPLTDKVKDMFMKELPWDTFKLSEDGTIPGLTDVIINNKTAYKGLFSEEQENKEDIKSEDTSIKGTVERVEDNEVVKGEDVEDSKKTTTDEHSAEVSNNKGLNRGNISFGVNSKSYKSKTNASDSVGLSF